MNPSKKKPYRFKDHSTERLLSLSELRGMLHGVVDNDNGFSACCPAHADKNPSLGVSEGGDGRILMHCHTGCTFEQICKALKVSQSQLRPRDTKPSPKNSATAAKTRSAATVKSRTPAAKPKATVKDQTTGDFGKLASTYRKSLTSAKLEELSEELGVTAASLVAIGAGWSEEQYCYTFPECAADGTVIGILRRDSKDKKAMAGGQRGLCIPANFDKSTGPILVPEGPSDVAACLSMGLYAIGRPAAIGGVQHLLGLLKPVSVDRPIIVVGEMDAKSSGIWPGRDAAEKVAKELAAGLGREVWWALPPDQAKDTRIWLELHRSEAELTALGRTYLDKLLDKPHVEKPIIQPRLEWLSTPTFLQKTYDVDFLIANMLVAGQPAVVGGPKKALKSSIATALAYALGTGNKFLGHFPTTRKVRVAVINGESGAATVQNTLRRIANRKQQPFGVEPIDCDAYWGFRLPQLSNADDLASLRDNIAEVKPEVLIVDPLYLCLLEAGSGLQAQNLYDMGPLLKRVSDTCLEQNVTPILVHHYRKDAGQYPRYDMPELDSLAFGGIAEFARQWMLVSRREKYDVETGVHRLWMSVGGSVGFAGEYALDIDEGPPSTDVNKRYWTVTVESAAKARKTKVEEKKQLKQQQERTRLAEDIEKIEKHLRQLGPTGDTATGIHKARGLSKERVERALAALRDQAALQDVDVVKPSGKSSRPYKGVALASFFEDKDADEA